ncbi:MAG TPA: TIGR02677 family protein [Acidimicrobiales bacterium]|nr:TIGR02677 family protein [Acidimicrobiales bacterium]
MSDIADSNGVHETLELIGEREETGRRLFRYINGDEWRDYRSIMDVFAGTFFSEFTPDEVAAQLASIDGDHDPSMVAERLESLRRWGNLTVSSSVGHPTSIADYYRRRNRYLITRAGQEVHTLVEGVLTRVDEVRDVSTGRLRTMLDALRALDAADAAAVDGVALADLVREVFDPHQSFTSEITQFFAAINQWQSRYDLSADEFNFFAEVLVGYVAERLDEIERTSRPIGLLLTELEPKLDTIIERANRGLAARVEQAGLADSVTVTRAPGSTHADWEHLFGWFVTRPGRPSRIEKLGREAISAIRTLTLNLARLSRVGIDASSRRADFLRLARFFADATPENAPLIAVAAFGLHATNHWGVRAEDGADPVSTATPWHDAPRALVPLSLRERGDTANRGRATPIPDRTAQTRLLRMRREQELAASRRVDAELLDGPDLQDRVLSSAAFARLQHALAQALRNLPVNASGSSTIDGQLRCAIERTLGHHTVVSCSEGALTLRDLKVEITAADATPPPAVVGVPDVG